MSAPLRFGYAGNPFGPVDDNVDLAVRAERAGFDTFVIADLGGAGSPFVVLSAVARATTTIRLSTFVLNTGLWEPHTTVREFATLDAASGGRVDIALGSGIPRPGSAEVMPPTRAGRMERLTETVGTLRAAFGGDLGPSPAFIQTPPPLLIAGGSRASLELSAEQADGFILAHVPPTPKVTLPPGELLLPEREPTIELIGRLRELAGPRELELASAMPVHVTDDAAAEAARLATIHTYLSAEAIAASPKMLIGTVEEVAAQIVERRDAIGFTYNVLRGADPETLAPILAAARAAA